MPRSAARSSSTSTVSATGRSSRNASRASKDASTRRQRRGRPRRRGRQRVERRRHVRGKLRIRDERRRLVLAEDEPGEDLRVPGGGRTSGRKLRQRPPRVGLRVAGEDPRLHRADDTAPAPRRREREALAVGGGRAPEPLRAVLPAHPPRETDGPCGHRHPDELPLPRAPGPRPAGAGRRRSGPRRPQRPSPRRAQSTVGTRRRTFLRDYCSCSASSRSSAVVLVPNRRRPAPQAGLRVIRCSVGPEEA